MRNRLESKFALALVTWLTLVGIESVPLLAITTQSPKRDTEARSDLASKDEVLLKDLDKHFPFVPPTDKEAWKTRAAELKQQLKVSLGLDPMPRLPQTPAVVHSLIRMDGYTVEKVILESFPGLFITGNLYRPIQVTGKVPAVLCPHGHWANARFYDAAPNEVNRLLANGEERFVNAARNHIQARCVQLARMGCIVFHWDMLGNSDSQQISMQRAHGFRERTSDEQTNDQGWVLYSPEAEGHLQSVMGIQTAHTLRAVDFLLGLPEVDANRIGITGASGGGTQTFIAAAIDPRIQVAFPAVMVSTGMQGGCTCENACGLRVNTGNVEIAALIAPRPLGMTAADDWTKTMPRDGFPELQRLYAQFQATDKVALYPSLHFGHNYNHVSRVAMYGWINRHFALGQPEPVLEREIEYLGKEELTVWDREHPMPTGGLELERRILKWWQQDARDQMMMGDATQIRSRLTAGWRTLLAPALQDIDQVEWDERDAGRMRLRQGESMQFASFANGSPQNALLVSTQPIDASSNGLESKLNALYKKRKNANDDRLQFSLVQCTSKRDLQPLVGNPRRSAAYTFGYNAPYAVRLSSGVGASLKKLFEASNESVELWSDEKPFVAIAAAYLEPTRVKRLVLIDTGWRLAQAKDIDDVDFVPGSLRYWDWPGLVACLESIPTTVIRSESAVQADDWKQLNEAGLLKHVQFIDR